GKLWLWERYNNLGPAQRAELIRLATGESAITFASMEPLSAIFGRHLCHGGPSLYSPGIGKLLHALQAPALMMRGWYDWGLGHTLVSWKLITSQARPAVALRSRLLIAPSAHNVPGYHEGKESHPELERSFRTTDIVEVLLRWYAAVREDATDIWPT